MDQFGGPAALGGAITCLMLGAWMLGRWQSGLAEVGNRRDASPVASAHPYARKAQIDGGAVPVHAPPCQEAARAERSAALETDASLSELHADITAYRLTQQILSGVEVGELRLAWSASGEIEPCRFMGISGRPTCPLPVRTTETQCACDSCAAKWRHTPLRAVQPSSEASAFTRV